MTGILYFRYKFSLIFYHKYKRRKKPSQREHFLCHSKTHKPKNKKKNLTSHKTIRLHWIHLTIRNLRNPSPRSLSVTYEALIFGTNTSQESTSEGRWKIHLVRLQFVEGSTVTESSRPSLSEVRTGTLPETSVTSIRKENSSPIETLV